MGGLLMRDTVLNPTEHRCEKTKEPGPLGEAGKQRPIVARQPPIKHTVTPAFQAMQEPVRSKNSKLPV